MARLARFSDCWFVRNGLPERILLTRRAGHLRDMPNREVGRVPARSGHSLGDASIDADPRHSHGLAKMAPTRFSPSTSSSSLIDMALGPNGHSAHLYGVTIAATNGTAAKESAALALGCSGLIVGPMGCGNRLHRRRPTAAATGRRVGLATAVGDRNRLRRALAGCQAPAGGHRVSTAPAHRHVASVTSTILRLAMP
jgi:hypothetical protein